MEMTLETLGQLERRLHVAVPKAQIEGEIQKRLAQLAKTAKIPGFRPGKVPLKMVAQQYGSQVRSDVISDTVQASLNDAIRTQNLRVAGYPRIEPKQDVAEDEFGFSAVFEVYPEIKLGDLSTVTIIRPVVEVGPADVDRTIEILRKQRTHYSPVTRPAQTGDRALVDFTGTIDGLEFPGGQARDFAITLGEGKMLPPFETALSGMSPGEVKTFTLTFPSDYHGQEVAGKQAEFVLTLKSLSEPHLTPEVFRPQAEERVAFSLILSEVVRQHGLQARPEQIRTLVEEAAQSFEQPEAVIRWHYEQPERLNEYEVRAVERNVIDFALQRARVEDQPTLFSALMEPAT